MLIFLILSGGHFNNKISFEPTLFSQNYSEDLLSETRVGSFWLFRYSPALSFSLYIYIYIYIYIYEGIRKNIIQIGEYIMM